MEVAYRGWLRKNQEDHDSAVFAPLRRIHLHLPSALHGEPNKKLNCRRETARCFVSLNISLNRARSVKSFKMVPFESLDTVSIFALHSNDSSTLYQFQHKAKYWPINRDFFITPGFDAPVREFPVGVLPWRLVWTNYRMVWLLGGKKSLTNVTFQSSQ